MTKSDAADLLGCSVETPCEEIIALYSARRSHLLVLLDPSHNVQQHEKYEKVLDELDQAIRILCPNFQPIPHYISPPPALPEKSRNVRTFWLGIASIVLLGFVAFLLLNSAKSSTMKSRLVIQCDVDCYVTVDSSMSELLGTENYKEWLLTEGKHEIKIASKDFPDVSWEKSLIINHDDTLRIELADKLPVNLTLNSDLECLVSIDNRELRLKANQPTIMSINAGKYLVKAKSIDGNNAWDNQIEIFPKTAKTIQITLKKAEELQPKVRATVSKKSKKIIKEIRTEFRGEYMGIYVAIDAKNLRTVMYAINCIDDTLRTTVRLFEENGTPLTGCSSNTYRGECSFDDKFAVYDDNGGMIRKVILLKIQDLPSQLRTYGSKELKFFVKIDCMKELERSEMISFRYPWW